MNRHPTDTDGVEMQVAPSIQMIARKRRRRRISAVLPRLALACSLVISIRIAGAFVGIPRDRQTHEYEVQSGDHRWKTIGHGSPPNFDVLDWNPDTNRFETVFGFIGQSVRPERQFISDNGMLISIGSAQDEYTEGAVRFFDSYPRCHGMVMALYARDFCGSARLAYPWERRNDAVSASPAKIWFGNASLDGKSLYLTTTGLHNYVIDTDSMTIQSRSINCWTPARWGFWILMSVPAMAWAFERTSLLWHRLRTGLAWRQRHRCQMCGYLLLGLSEFRCPECGADFKKQSPGRA